MQTKYQIEQLVYERIRPFQKLIVKKFAFDVYYCQPEETPTERLLTYLERDLAPIGIQNHAC